MLEFQAPLHAIRLATDNNQRSHETDGLKIFAELIRVPHLAVPVFEVFSTPWYDVDFSNAVAANRLGRIVHVFALKVANDGYDSQGTLDLRSFRPVTFQGQTLRLPMRR